MSYGQFPSNSGLSYPAIGFQSADPPLLPSFLLTDRPGLVGYQITIYLDSFIIPQPFWLVAAIYRLRCFRTSLLLYTYLFRASVVLIFSLSLIFPCTSFPPWRCCCKRPLETGDFTLTFDDEGPWKDHHHLTLGRRQRRALYQDHLALHDMHVQLRPLV